MESVSSIFKTVSGAKAIVEAIAEPLLAGKIKPKELLAFYQGAKPSQQGRCLEALELVTRTRPALAGDFLNEVVAAINSENPGLQREASRVVANTVKEFPDWSGKVLPGLLKNADDEGTVVRWSAALALSEIAKANPAAQKKLRPHIKVQAESEENNAIRNIYAKALRAIEKSNS